MLHFVLLHYSYNEFKRKLWAYNVETHTELNLDIHGVRHHF